MNDSLPEANPWMWIGKLAPPQMQLSAVRREALLERLGNLPAVVLTLVVSPPGFGKTTLMAQLRAISQGDDQPRAVAWLTLDEADSDPNRFLTYLLLALESAGIDLGGLSQRARIQSLDPNPRQTVAALLQALERGNRRITLMLDDYHLAAGTAVDEIFLSLLEHGGPWLHFVVASRLRPRWPLAALKARGLLHNVDASDLVLSLSEAAEIFGADFDRAALAIVHSRTEGWAVALQLARLWLARGAGTSHGLQALSGRVADVAEYLAEQIVENLPFQCREFLLETSLLERFNAELADVVRERDDSAAILRELAPYDALLVPLDAGRSWFRYHMMLSDFLQSRLDLKRAQRIHRAAALWLADQEDWALAVSHALQAHDTPLAVSLVHRAGGWKLVLSKGIQYTQGLLQQFDELTRRTESELLLLQAYLHAKLGDEPLSFELLRLAGVAIDGRPELQRDFIVIEALVDVYFDRLDARDRWPTTAEEANQCLADDPLGQATLLCAGAMMAMAGGRMDDAINAAQVARTRMRLAASPLGENYSLMHLAQALSLTGRIPAARRTVDEALALAEANFGTESSLMALVGCFKAQHLYLEGQWAEVLPLLRIARDTLEHIDGWFDLFALTAEITWRIAMRQEGLQAALTAQDITAQMARQRRLPRLARMVNAWRVDLLGQCGFVSQARQEAQASALEELLPISPAGLSAEQLDWRLLEAGSLALARLNMAAGAPHIASARLERAAPWLENLGLLLPAWRLRLLAMLAKRQANEGEVSALETQDALAPALNHGMAGLLLEAGPAMLPVLQQIEGMLPPQVMAVMAQLRGWLTHPPRQRTPFSAKESEVLAFLVAGQQNKTIARSLGISENTVKFHLKHIFLKLGVDNRSAAMAAAMQQGFAPPRIDPSERG